MDITLFYIWGSIGAAFFLFVGALIGFTVFERRFVALQTALNLAVERNKKYFTQLGEAHENLHKEYNVVRELEISLLHAGESIERCHQQVEQAQKNWKYADEYRKVIVNYLVVNHLWDFATHGADPMTMLALLINTERAEALDPQVSQKAKNLYVKGVRAGAKKGRAQMQKIMQKSIDNQAATICEYTDGLAMSRVRYGRFVIAVRNVLDDKIALPGVRRALRKAISLEVTRLHAADNNKGE